MQNNFKTIGIFGKYYQFDTTSNILETLIKYLEKKGLQIYLDQQSAQKIKSNHHTLEHKDIRSRIDLAIAIGGDGTLLGVARSLAENNIPILGINLGRIGFVVSFNKERLEQELDKFFTGNFLTEKRIILQLKILNKDKLIFKNYAFNDVVLSKVANIKMIEFEIFVNGKFLNSQRSDGLIISTPTGSTAYALSAGGPILQPNLDVIALVSNNPHSMNYRPLVLHSNSEIKILGISKINPIAKITCDGQVNFEVNNNHKIIISQYHKKITLLHPYNYDYYSMLRSKLHWGGVI